MQSRQTWVEAYGPVEYLDRIGEPLLPHIEFSQSLQRRHVVILNPQGSLQGRLGFIQLPACQERQAKIVGAVGIARIQSHGPSVGLQLLRALTQAAENRSQVVPGRRIFPVRINRLLKFPAGFLQLA